MLNKINLQLILVFMDTKEIKNYIYLYLFATLQYLPLFVCNTASKENHIQLIEWLEYKDTVGPMEDYNNITHSDNGLQLDPSKLSIVWTAEGSSAGLYLDSELIAYIPEWSSKEFPGFSKYVTGESVFALPLDPAVKEIEEKLEFANSFWLIADDYWKDFQESNVKAIESFTSEIKQYWGIDGNAWPPKGLALTSDAQYCYTFTIGLSALRQPMSESIFRDEYTDNTRIELGFICQNEYKDKLINFIPSISSMSTLPWNNISTLAHGHTILYEFDDNFVGVWLISGNKIELSPQYEKFCGDKINILWIVPINKDDYEYLLECNIDELKDIDVPEDIVYFNNKSKDIINILKNNKIYK